MPPPAPGAAGACARGRGPGGYGGEADTGMLSPQQQVLIRKQRTLSMFTLILRLASLVFAILSLALVASAEDHHQLADSYITYKALRTRPSKFIVGLGVVISLYELVQMVLLCLHTLPCVSTYAGTLIIWIFDQLFAYLMFAACTAGATDAAQDRSGDDAHEGGCDGVWTRVCSQYEGGIGMGFLAFAALAVLALLSALKFARHVW